MHADTPPESIHSLPRTQLSTAGITFLVGRLADGVPVAMGALKQVEPGHGELKSMHVLREQRGRGFSRAILDRLLEQAWVQGMARVSLETGVQPSFIAARALYARAGFDECDAFTGYQPDPHSLFMTKAL